ncbi:MAG: transketolase family protein [Flexilinea sp.]
MFKCIYNGAKEAKAGKNVFGETIRKILDEDSQAVYLDADLMSSIGTSGLDIALPNQAIEVGIQEANMMGVAGGLSAVGKKPFVHTFAAFAGRRCYDQVFISIAYAKNSVRIIGSDPGVTSAYNGGTHMPFEDICLYRAIPHSTVIEFTDNAMTAALLPVLKDHQGLTYCRLSRKNCIAIYSEDSTFEPGVANVLRDGKDVTIIACGMMVAESLMAAKELEKEGISAAVIDMFTIKPLDEARVLEYARKTGAIVTAENANIVGGLGAAVAGYLSETRPTPVIRIGVKDEFGQVGTPEYLAVIYGLTSIEIISAAKKAISMK